MNGRIGGTVGIGLTTSKFSKVGGKDNFDNAAGRHKGSVGLIGKHGNIFHDGKTITDRDSGWEWGPEDVVGMLCFSQEVAAEEVENEEDDADIYACIQFTLNGCLWGEARVIKGRAPLYPTVSFDYKGSVAETNFGDDPFMYNLSK